jgi:hypothetical protein
MSQPTDLLRNTDLQTLARTLEDQRGRNLDVVVAGKSLRATAGELVVPQTVALPSDDGVTNVDGYWVPTTVGIETLASVLSIPTAYAKRLHAGHSDLFDTNVNYWLERSEDTRYLMRLRRGASPDASSDGVLRAVLSDSYKTIDNWDVLFATLKGLQRAGIADAKVRGDLTDRRMYVQVTSESISANALAIVDGYRDPFNTSRSGRDYPLLFAGLEITNSEVGQGAVNVVPRVVWQVCTNGQTFTKDAMRKVHLGAKLAEGEVVWSPATVRKNLDLITSQVADAVAQFMSPAYLEKKITAMARDAGAVIEEPATVITEVSRSLGFTKDQATDILNAFIDGGQRTAGGVMQAVTATAKSTPDGDAAYDLEGLAFDAMRLAARVGTARR